MNSNIYQYYNKYYCKNINLYNGIEGVICILIPFCILNNVFIESDIEIDEKFYNNRDNILNYYRNIHNDNDLNFNYKFKIKYSDANLNNNNKKVILPFTLGVDSFISYKNIEIIDIIIYIIGFDIEIFKNISNINNNQYNFRKIR